MKIIFRMLVLGIVLISCNEKNKKNKIEESKIVTDKELTKDISNLIDSLYIVDQKIQSDAMKAGNNGETEKMHELIAEQLVIFERHIPILKNIYDMIGYPTIEQVGKESARKYFTLVQHSDADIKFQEKMLVEITKEVKKGNMNGENFALLTDRVQLAQNKPQVYGTQLNYDINIGHAYPINLIDSINVNARRENIGIEPIEKYLNKSIEVHFQMNKVHYDKIGIKEPKLYKTK